MPVRRKRRPAVARTRAGTSLLAAAAEAGAHMAMPPMMRKRPRALLVEPGDAVRRTRPVAAQMPLRRPMAVAATPSRARNAKIEAVNWRGTVNASTQSATCCPSAGGDPAELEPGHDECCGREAEEPDRERTRDRAKHDARAPSELLLRGGLCGGAAHPTASACGAPVLMRVRNQLACVSASVWQLPATSFSSLSRNALAAWSAIVHVTATAFAIR